MPRANTKKELDEARDYLLDQLEADREAQAYLDHALVLAARRIVSISSKYGIPPHLFRFSANPRLKAEVQAVLAVLREMLYDYMEKSLTFNAPEEKKGKYVPLILTAEDHGKTLKERIALYVGRWGYEVESVIAGAGIAGVTDLNVISASIENYLHEPWSNPYFKAGEKAGKATRLKSGGVSYGTGRTNVAANGLSVAIGAALMKGYVDNWFRIGRNGGAIGFRTFRNSSVPCDVCDEEATYFHYMGEAMPPFHNRCVCGIAFVYANGEIDK